jgi:hypothetical protein
VKRSFFLCCGLSLTCGCCLFFLFSLISFFFLAFPELTQQHIDGRAALMKELNIDQDYARGDYDDEEDGGYGNEGAKLFVCGQPMFKMHPLFFDRVVHEILLRNNNSHIVIVGGEYGEWDQIMARR